MFCHFHYLLAILTSRDSKQCLKLTCRKYILFSKLELHALWHWKMFGDRAAGTEAMQRPIVFPRVANLTTLKSTE